MEILFVIFFVLQSVSISLGVGASTLAILNFFAAISDGHIDETERAMMGIVYRVLRVAMVLILLTTAVITALKYNVSPADVWQPAVLVVWIALGMLYLNAVLMTKHIMPSTVGPALQASSWYALGIITALQVVLPDQLSLVALLGAYIALFLLAVTIVNGMMAYLKRR